MRRHIVSRSEFEKRFPDATATVQIVGGFDLIAASEQWMKTQTAGFYHANILGADGKWCLTIRFEDPNEAFAFKMRWR